MSSIEKIPSEVEKKYNKLVQTRELLARVAQEKAVLEGSLAEVERLIEELESLGEEAEVYTLKGVVLVKSSRDKILEELKEKRESLKLKIATLKETEEKLRKDVERLTAELRKFLEGAGGAAVGGAGV